MSTARKMSLASIDEAQEKMMNAHIRGDDESADFWNGVLEKREARFVNLCLREDAVVK